MSKGEEQARRAETSVPDFLLYFPHSIQQTHTELVDNLMIRTIARGRLRWERYQVSAVTPKSRISQQAYSPSLCILWTGRRRRFADLQHTVGRYSTKLAFGPETRNHNF